MTSSIAHEIAPAFIRLALAEDEIRRHRQKKGLCLPAEENITEVASKFTRAWRRTRMICSPLGILQLHLSFYIKL